MSGLAGHALAQWQALVDQAALERLAAQFALALPDTFVLHLRGELGSGKSTFARAFIRALLPGARVKSPTYGLVEPYALPGRRLLHLDLYRLRDPAELENLGVRDLAETGTGLLIEWPERGGERVPAPDLEVALMHAGTTRSLSIRACDAEIASRIAPLLPIVAS